MAVGDRKKAREEFFANLDWMLEEIAHDKAVRLPPSSCSAERRDTDDNTDVHLFHKDYYPHTDDSVDNA